MNSKIWKPLVLGLALVFIGIDQATKSFAATMLKESGAMSVEVIPGLLEFSYLENPAAALGLFGNVIWLVMALAAAVAVGIIIVLFVYKDHSAFSYLACSLLLAGGVGNLVDRVMIDGKVIDFIHVMFFPYVFNVADCCVTVGAVCLVAHYILRVRQDRRSSPGAEREQ